MSKVPLRRVLRAALAALALLVLAGWIVPSFLSVEHYRRLLRSGLEADLGRSVTFGSLSFHLLPHPEFVIRNVLIGEDPRFGIEPFARIDRVDCALRWASLWRGRLSLSGLELEGPRVNLARMSGEGWNVEGLLRRRNYGLQARNSSRTIRSPGLLEVGLEDGQINFKADGVKGPFIVDDVNGRFFANPGSHSLHFDLSGRPSRTDLMVPSPGPVEISGMWSPGQAKTAPLNATVRFRNSLLYSWFPLFTGRIPEIYGLMDGDIVVEGTPGRLRAQGRVVMTQVHRWESLPPIRPLPITLQFGLSVDRPARQVFVDPVNLTFASAHLHLTGSVRYSGASPPAMDLVLAVQHSRLEDLMRMASQLSGRAVPPLVAGELNGLLTIRGTRGHENCAGFFGGRDLVLKTRAGNFLVSPAGIRIDRNVARLMPLRIRLAPQLSLTAEGYWGPESVGASPFVKPRPRLRSQRRRVLPAAPAAGRVYRVTLSAHAVSLHVAARFARSLGIAIAKNLDVTGVASGTLILNGNGWPPSRPEATGRLQVVDAQLAAPGLTEPLEFPQADIRFEGDHISASPVILMIGGSRFSGSLDHHGTRRDPWMFHAQCDHLAIEQAAQWFEALGHRQPASLLARIPGLASLASRLQAGRNIFSSLSAQGTFRANSITYHHLILTGFRGGVQISGRRVRIANAQFSVAGGQGQGSARVDLRSQPAHVAAQAQLTHARLAALAPYFPRSLRGIRGFVSAGGDFTARGLSRPEMAASLDGHSRIEFRNVSLGSFDPVQAAAAAMAWGRLTPLRAEAGLRSARFDLLFRNGKAVVSSQPFTLGGAKFTLGGFIQPGGNLNLRLTADLSRAVRRRIETGNVKSDPKTTAAYFGISGPYFNPLVRRAHEPARGTP